MAPSPAPSLARGWDVGEIDSVHVLAVRWFPDVHVFRVGLVLCLTSCCPHDPLLTGPLLLLLLLGLHALLLGLLLHGSLLHGMHAGVQPQQLSLQTSQRRRSLPRPSLIRIGQPRAGPHPAGPRAGTELLEGPAALALR